MLRAAIVAALFTTVCAACTAVLMAASAAAGPSAATSASPSDSPSPSPTATPPVSDTLTTTVVRAVTVHSGSVARVRYRADDTAGGAVYAHVGRSAVQRLAGVARMGTFRAGSHWIVSKVAAADMARFFRDMERYIPRAHRRFANGLLTHIVWYQRWGIPVAAEPLGYRVYFKPGWLGAWILANEAARLERRSVRIGLAAFTEDNPTPTYGRDTIAGVTARLLRR